jgi:hypothetical protein
MKGRITSFQRFGSSLGTTGSVLHKFIRSLGDVGEKEGRDRELLGDGPAGVDKSDGKGIYNKTVKSGDDLKYDFEEGGNFGEEVYGCIAKPFGKDALQEKDSKTAINCRKATIKDSPHYEENKRKWYHADPKKSYEDYAAIPQENLPLTVNSKFPMKYCSRSGIEEYGDDLVIDIPKGIGFTSGALIRPLRFTESAEPMKNGYYSTFGSGFGGLKEGQPIPTNRLHHAHILKSVPLETAHKIINCCKEIVLTGSVSHSIERNSIKCKDWLGNEGPDKSEAKQTGEMMFSPCPPGTCTDVSHTFTVQCLSSKQTTTISLDGDLEMTAYRYKQAADVWEEKEKQKTLDISGNAFFGSLEEAALRKLTRPDCLFKDADSLPQQPLPDPTLKQVYVFQKQTKLSSGCLPYPITNNSMLVASEEDNMKSKRFENPDCETNTAIAYNYLESTASPFIEKTYGFGFDSAYPSNQTLCYEGGQLLRSYFNNEDTFVRPLHVSGPSLFCSFNGIGWDYSQIGKETPETLWEKDECASKELTFHHNDWKMTWNSTGLKTTFKGNCPQGFEPLDRYNKKANTCKCPSELKDCGSDWGELKLICECQGPCTNPDPAINSCQEPMLISTEKKSCDGTYGITFAIGKYVGHPTEYSGLYETAPVPLITKVENEAKEDLTLWFSGYISDVLPYYFYKQEPSLGTAIFINSETADKNKPSDNSLYRYEKKQAGTLTIKCEDWQDTAEIWVVLRIEKETACITPAAPFVSFGVGNGGYNVQSALELGNPYKGCKECVDDKSCCDPGGCNGVIGQSPCCNATPHVIDDPCGISFRVSGAKKTCDDNSKTTCEGQCILVDECGCCNCAPSEEDDDCAADPCEPFKQCAPLEYTQFKNLSCYGSAHEEDKHQFTLDLTIEFKLLTEME